MILQMVRARRRQVLVDINTQRDFLLADGNACIRNHRRVLGHIRRVMAWARTNEVPIISTCEVVNNGHSHIAYDNGSGLAKIPYTLHNNRLSFSADNNTDIPYDILRRYKQVILPKRCVDPFEEPRIDRLLSEVRAGEFILIGTTTEGAVQAMALGLLQRNKTVSVIVDAVGAHDIQEAKMAMRKMEAKGASMIETKKIAGTSHLGQVRVCNCSSCLRVVTKTAASPGPN